MSHKHQFSNLDAVLAAEQRAARFLMPAHEDPEQRAKASAEAMRALDEAVRALIAADRTDAAMKAARLQAILVGGA